MIGDGPHFILDNDLSRAFNPFCEKEVNTPLMK